jgi:hypothetical protein
MPESRFERLITRATGEPIQSLRNTPIDDRRERIETALGGPTRYYSAFPAAGRGNVLRERFVTHEECDRILDGVLGKK